MIVTIRGSAYQVENRCRHRGTGKLGLVLETNFDYTNLYNVVWDDEPDRILPSTGEVLELAENEPFPPRYVPPEARPLRYGALKQP